MCGWLPMLTYPPISTVDLYILPRGKYLWRPDIHKALSTSTSWTGVRFPHSAGRCRPAGSLFSSWGCWGCVCAEGFMFRGWDSVLPWSAESRNHERSAIRRLGRGFHTVRVDINPWGRRFCLHSCGRRFRYTEEFLNWR